MDDLLQEMIGLGSRIRRKKEEETALSQIKDLQDLDKSISHAKPGDQYKGVINDLTAQIEKMRLEAEKTVKEIDSVNKEVLAEKDRNSEVVKGLQEKQATSQKVYPRARYSVNIYRDVSHIRWHTSSSNVDSSEVIGFTSGKSSAKTFKFDTSKQSQFFITNSLWDMEGEAS